MKREPITKQNIGEINGNPNYVTLLNPSSTTPAIFKHTYEKVESRLILGGLS